MLKQTTSLKAHWFFGPVLNSKGIYAQVILASVLINLFALASSLYIMTVYDRVIPNNAIESLYALTSIIIVIILFDFIMKIIRGNFIDRASQKVDRQVSTALFDKISRHDTIIGKQATGALASTVRDFDLLKDVIGSATFAIFADLPFIFLFLVVLYWIGGPVAAVPALIVPLVILFAAILQPIVKRMSELSMLQGKSKQAVMVEMIGALETVKMTQGNNMLRNRWLNSVLNQGQTSAKTKLTSQLASHFAQFGQQASQIGIVVYGVFLISSGNLTMGQLIACVILSGRTMAPLGQITGLLGRMNQARSAYRGLNEVLGVTTEEEERADFVKRPNLKGDLSLKGVSFTYEDQPDPMLQNISLDIQAGQKIAILGRIGSGKTTLLRLICGLQAPDTGAVLLDNADIRQIRPQDVRKNIGVVLQNPILFSGTIRDNLLMGKPEATDEELIDAARIAGADSFIGMLPGGFDFPLSERGQELSSGMRQSIAIARAVISKPNILVMDEPTASMDNATEAQLVDRLMESMTDTTCLFVTHRGAMLKMADHVVVMEKGQIAMAGPRDKVLEKLQGAANAQKDEKN